MNQRKGELTPEQRKRALKTGAGGLAIAAALSLTAVWEGTKNDPYYDSVKVLTVCTGETNVVMKHYTDAECAAMFEARMKQFQAGVLRINPRLKDDPYQLAAHTSFAYNVGLATYAKSSVAKLYRAGYEEQACRAIGRYKFAGGKKLSGLEARRNGDKFRVGEVEVCLKPYP